MEAVKILPSNLQIKYDYLNIEGLYVATIIIIKYEPNIQMLKTIEAITSKEDIEVSFHISRENNYEILKKLTNIISQSSSEINSVSKNQIDINVINNTKLEATELRKKIQIEDEQVYLLSTYIVIKAKSLDELILKQKAVINMLYAKQIIAKPANFRQKEAYIATLPFMNNNESISKYSYSIFTEEALAKLFPFFEREILNKEGILLGKTNNNLCMIDLFDEKNNNYNMCVFGSSGAGKSYFVKLMILRNAYKGIRQIIVDPEGEYVELVKILGGQVYNMQNYNPFEINESCLQSNDFFGQKVEQIIQCVLLLVPSLDKELLRNTIIKIYKSYGIDKNEESLYDLQDANNLYIKPKYKRKFPTMKDLYDVLKEQNANNDIELLNNSRERNYTTSTNNGEIYCFDLSNKDIKDISEEMKVFMPKIYELIQQKTLIYFDELWKTIGFGQDSHVAQNIYNMFKTLRKKKAGVIAISQDICDLFNLDNGNFGKSILNNTNTKVMFKMEWQDIEMFERILKNNMSIKNISALTRGNAHICMNSTSFNLEIKASPFEHKLIEGEIYEESINCNE